MTTDLERARAEIIAAFGPKEESWRDNCEICDRPNGWENAELESHGDDGDGCDCEQCVKYCWGGPQCMSARVDWRERTFSMWRLITSMRDKTLAHLELERELSDRYRKITEYCHVLIKLAHEDEIDVESLDVDLFDLILGDDWKGAVVPKHVLVYDSDLGHKDLGGDPDCAGCGHAYHRHFDWMLDNTPIGCKYCDCGWFVPTESDSA